MYPSAEQTLRPMQGGQEPYRRDPQQTVNVAEPAGMHYATVVAPEHAVDWVEIIRILARLVLACWLTGLGAVLLGLWIAYA